MNEPGTDYRDMWTALGLDLDMHDALLRALGQMYSDTFLTQANRPKSMGYFDFVMSEVHGLRIKELVTAQQQGRKVIGSFCVYVPEELILAVDGISVGLCAGAEFATAEAEHFLPRNTCALIKSFFGFTLARVCPYIAASDLVVGENTCDGKKKGYEPFRPLVKSLLILDLPQMKTEAGKTLLRGEYQRLANELERITGQTMTAERLRSAIAVVNAKRQALRRLALLRSAAPAPISGLDALLINQVAFYDDPIRFTAAVNAVCDELEERIAQKIGVMAAGTPRMVISGCPMAVPNWKLPQIIEQAGAVIVGEESCVGECGMRNTTDDSGQSVDALLDAITDRYWTINCAIFTPNPGRCEHVQEMVQRTNADGLIHYSLQFCAPYQIESVTIERELETRGTPVLRIDTDYSAEDREQLRTRVEAFIERIRN